MRGIPSSRQQPNPVSNPNKRPIDFRATSQQQSSNGSYDEHGQGGRFKKILFAIVLGLILTILATILIDALTGQKVS